MSESAETASTETTMSSTDDLALLTYLDEKAMLHHLESRYNDPEKKIYTRVGDILIAVNPFESLDIYGRDTAQHYRQVCNMQLWIAAYRLVICMLSRTCRSRVNIVVLSLSLL